MQHHLSYLCLYKVVFYFYIGFSLYTSIFDYWLHVSKYAESDRKLSFGAISGSHCVIDHQHLQHALQALC